MSEVPTQTPPPPWYEGKVVPLINAVIAVAAVIGIQVAASEAAGLIAAGGLTVVGATSFWSILRGVIARNYQR